MTESKEGQVNDAQVYEQTSERKRGFLLSNSNNDARLEMKLVEAALTRTCGGNRGLQWSLLRDSF